MAQTVIDDLEPVKIDKQHSRRTVPRAACFLVLVECL